MEDEKLVRDAELGEEARNFLASELGKKLCALASERHDSAMVALSKADPHDAQKIMKLQNQVQLFEQFDDWLHEIVSVGDQALNAWRQQNEQK